MELKKIAALAQSRHVCFAPHNPSGPVANAATLQLGACVENFYIHEIMLTDVVWRADVTDEYLRYEDGYLLIPDRPGIGLEINEEEIAKHPITMKTLRHYDGRLTDIRPRERSENTFYFKGI